MWLLSLALLFQCPLLKAGIIRIGYIDSNMRIGPAIDIAIEHFQNNGIFLGYNFSVSPLPSACTSAKSGSVAAIRFHDDFQSDVVFGPLCSTVCFGAGYSLSYWNIPYFPAGCTDAGMSDKSTFTTLIRLFTGFQVMGDAFIEIFRKFNWKTVVSFSNTDIGTRCRSGHTALVEALIANNISVNEWIRMRISVTDAEIDTYLARIRSRGRVVLMCHDNSDVRRRIMFRAQDLDMVDNYVYLLYDLLPENIHFRPWNTGSWDTSTLEHRRKAFYSMKVVTLDGFMGPRVDSFLTEVAARHKRPPWNDDIGDMANPYAVFLYNSVYLYLSLVNETLANGEDFRDGERMLNKARSRSFSGVFAGNIHLDHNGDNLPTLSILQLGKGMDQMNYFASVDVTKPKGQSFNIFSAPLWTTFDGSAPLDIPACGLNNQFCQTDHTVRDASIGVGAGVLILCMAAMFVIYRKKKLERDLHQMLWKVDFNCVQLCKDRRGSSMAMIGSVKSFQTSASHGTDAHTDYSSPVALYKGSLVTVTMTSEQIALSRKDLIQLKIRKDLQHDNIVAFIGACIEPPNVCVLTQHCSKGTLQDVIANDDMKLDKMFKSSLISDLVNGVRYIHKSYLRCHGNLTSNNCVIDSRWVLKVGSFGTDAFKVKDQEGEYARYRNMLWTAPEVLKADSPCSGTPKGDVYSFAIILQEILYRAEPFFAEFIALTPKEIVDSVKKSSMPPFRPLPPDQLPIEDTEYTPLMRNCWAENPEFRPDFTEIKKEVIGLNKGRTNIMDNMVRILEKYASNLEEIVQQRTSQLSDEKVKTEKLLCRMLPRSIADQLMRGENVKPEVYESVTIYFSDIVGFTTLSSSSTPIQIIDLLNDLYTAFDATIAQYDVYKVETIGDAYMVVSGLPTRNEGRHVSEIADMSMALLREVMQFRIRHKPEEKLQLRIGLHTGICAAGVVGLTMPRYCLFGDTVNYASRMESTGLGLRIHISESAYDALRRFPGYVMEERGFMQIKGKGTQKTYWLLGKEGELVDENPLTEE